MLSSILLQELKFVYMSGVRPLKNYCPPTPIQSLHASPRAPKYKFILPDGKNPYKLEQPTDKFRQKPKSLTIGDLRKSIPAVALEAATREAIWTSCLGQTQQVGQKFSLHNTVSNIHLVKITALPGGTCISNVGRRCYVIYLTWSQRSHCHRYSLGSPMNFHKTSYRLSNERQLSRVKPLRFVAGRSPQAS